MPKIAFGHRHHCIGECTPASRTCRPPELYLQKLCIGRRQILRMHRRTRRSAGILLAARLAESALIAGALLVELRVLDAGWIAVSGESDWITPNAQRVREGISLERVFTSFMPQLGGRPNEVRFEPIVTAFSRSVAVKSNAHWNLIAGDLPSNEIQHRLANCKFAVAFQS